MSRIISKRRLERRGRTTSVRISPRRVIIFGGVGFVSGGGVAMVIRTYRIDIFTPSAGQRIVSVGRAVSLVRVGTNPIRPSRLRPTRTIGRVAGNISIVSSLSAVSMVRISPLDG